MELKDKGFAPEFGTPGCVSVPGSFLPPSPLFALPYTQPHMRTAVESESIVSGSGLTFPDREVKLEKVGKLFNLSKLTFLLY